MYKQTHTQTGIYIYIYIYIYVRHYNFPTTDFKIYSLDPSTTALWNDTLKPRLLGLMAACISSVSQGNAENLIEKDVFIVKYDAEKQQGLVPHRDSTHLSFNVALNEQGR